MNRDTFTKIVNIHCDQMKAVLTHKAKEYAHRGDRLHNFKTAAVINEVSVPEALWGMATKHLVSVLDLVYGNLENTEAMVDEKVGDLINYLVLLKAVLQEEREGK